MLGTLDVAGDRIFLVTPSVMVRKAVYDSLGFFDMTRYASAGDYEMWLRIATRYRIAVIDKPLMSYRVHEQQGSHHEVRTNMRLPDIAPVIESYRNDVSNPNVQRALVKYLDRTVLKTALKQNYGRCFGESLQTLEALRKGIYWPAALLLRAANHLRISLGIRPGAQDGP
jgi:hypothetical protein